ncbi:MAG: D-alanyl-D-alanine carboxypeptidase [Halieaceae bacterium]|nr:D-alanyl-D-alanine carboxypeptidase [Halieaceae bacterium]
MAVPTPSPPLVSAAAYLLMDADSGHVIVEKNADQPLAPASLTKIMTGYLLAHELAEGRASNDDEVLISRQAWAQNPLFAGSSLMWVEAGTRVRLEDLHRGLVVSSGNDAALAIAEHLAGSETAFAEMMNTHAQTLGMKGSNFVNSHGLPDPDHYTTPRDQAILAAALIGGYPNEYALYREREYTYNNIRQYNRNGLLAENSGVDGLKTGYTREAGYCLVASAKRDDMRLISVVMGSSGVRTRETATRELLNYGFRFYETHQLYTAGQELTSSRVWKGRQEQMTLAVKQQIYLTIPRGRHDDLEAVMEIKETIVAPVEAGHSFGKLRISLDGETLVTAPLVAVDDIALAGLASRLWDSVQMLFARATEG